MKKPTLKRARERADKAMSQYIRQKYADKHGYVQCVSCDGPKRHWKEMDNGHFIPRARGNAVRFLELNCAPQCPSCNRFDGEKSKITYTLWMIRTYGEDIIPGLMRKSREVVHYRVDDYLRIEAEYKAKLEGLTDG